MKDFEVGLSKKGIGKRLGVTFVPPFLIFLLWRATYVWPLDQDSWWGNGIEDGWERFAVMFVTALFIVVALIVAAIIFAFLQELFYWVVWGEKYEDVKKKREAAKEKLAN